MLYFFGFIISCVFGYFIAKDANSRGMNGTAWGIGSFLALIPVMPLYLIVRKPIISNSQINTNVIENPSLVRKSCSNSLPGDNSIEKINKSLDEDAYKIYLVKKYKIDFNAVLNKYIYKEVLYGNIELALSAAHSDEIYDDERYIENNKNWSLDEAVQYLIAKGFELKTEGTNHKAKNEVSTLYFISNKELIDYVKSANQKK